MANIMSSFKLQNHPSRNGFDLSNRHTFSAKLGELLPVQVKECLPGDKFKINLSHFSRTQPLNGPAYVRIREYYDFCFVPYRLLWKYFDQFINQMPNNVAANSITSESLTFTRHPHFPIRSIATYLENLAQAHSKDECGFSKADTTRKLLTYLGYSEIPVTSTEAEQELAYNYALNPFPLLAYQKIYNDIFRFDQWEAPLPHCFNIDYMNNPSDMYIPVSSIDEDANLIDMFNLRYANYPKDLIMGVLPNSQYGDVSIVTTFNGTSLYPGVGTNYSGMLFQRNGTAQMILGNASTPTYDYTDNLNDVFNFSILALRKAEFLQKWREVAQTAKQDYRDQIKAHWGVEISKARSGVVEYLGGITSNVQIEGEVNSNLADGSTVIKGTAISGSHGQIDFDVPEHGLIMCIYHAAPLLDYNAGFAMDRLNFKTAVTDYAIPEMDKTGMEQVNTAVVSNRTDAHVEKFGDWLGYAPRYIDYKTDIDKVFGIFTHAEDYKAWVAPFDINALAYLSQQSPRYQTFKVNSRFFDQVFAVSVDSTDATDQILANADFDIKVVRNLDTNGMPY